MEDILLSWREPHLWLNITCVLSWLSLPNVKAFNAQVMASPWPVHWVPISPFIAARQPIHTQKKNSSLNCISSSQWAFSCLFTTGFLSEMRIYSGVSYVFWACWECIRVNREITVRSITKALCDANPRGGILPIHSIFSRVYFLSPGVRCVSCVSYTLKCIPSRYIYLPRSSSPQLFTVTPKNCIRVKFSRSSK